ncbi:unnamed protein product [Nezara viridula]|uniref:PHD-type domain-containing protein n=1 Tax=Nezara viridula TaxID=85310 RepID=A0A9P0H6D2_NEZVI|nr:unnamed protein product [Nezara viridula]
MESDYVRAVIRYVIGPGIGICRKETNWQGAPLRARLGQTAEQWCSPTIAREEKKTMACTVTACQAIFHGKCLNADESEFEALRALRKNWVCPKCEKARKNIQPTDKCLSPPRSAPQQQTVDSTSQLLLAAIKNLTEEVKGLKFSLDANANEVILLSNESPK